MRGPIEIENIEERRREVGIDDAELREQIRRLAVGDCVLLTLLKPTRVFADQTLRVRITSIRGSSLRGKVVGKPARAGSSRPPPGTQLAFTTAHIHSIPEPARVALPRGTASLGRAASTRPFPPRPGQSLNSRRGLSMPLKPTPSRPPPAPRASAPARVVPEPPRTAEERLQHIAVLGRRVAEYVEFMAQVGGLNGTSAEARERAVAAFCDRLTVLEAQLARIHEELRLV